MTSVRQSLNLVGRAASIKQLAQQRNAKFPLLLRDFVGALPPGRIQRRVISLDFLEEKFGVFFNQGRATPLFQIRLDSPQKKFGQTTLTVAEYDAVAGYDHSKAIYTKELAGPGESLNFSIYSPLTHITEALTYNYYFQDVNSKKMTLNVVHDKTPGIELGIQFECGGPVELKVEGHTGQDVDFNDFNIKIKFGFDSKDGKVDLLHFLDFSNVSGHDERANCIFTDVNTDSTFWPGEVMKKIEDTVNQKIHDALGDGNNHPTNRDLLNAYVTQWLVGRNDFYVFNVVADDHTLTIDYVMPPGEIQLFPETAQPPLSPGLLGHIEHIVVLMMENRSFDHMLGYLSKDGDSAGHKRPDIDGLDGTNKNPHNGSDYPSFLLQSTEFTESPPHDHDPVANQMDGGKMDGFINEFAKKFPLDPHPEQIMGYHNATHVWMYDWLASEFLICQRWFAAHPGPTFCNRFYTLTGRLNRDSFGNWEFDNFSGEDFKPVFTRTIFDHLSEHGVSWRYYENRYCTLRLFQAYTLDDHYIVDYSQFLADASAGTLPSVSFIDPNFIDEADGNDNDDGAPSDIAAGQRLVHDVVQAVVSSPLWSNTLLLIVYDEHGGFYDHVNPLQFSSDQTSVPVSGIGHYGVRVPALVISPWVDKAKVSNVLFDHTSIAKTIARRFMSANPPDLGGRVTKANDLSAVLSSTPRQDRPTVPAGQPPAPRAARAVPSTPAADSTDFKDVLRTLQARYPLRASKVRVS